MKLRHGQTRVDKGLKQFADRFNAQTIRERGLIAFSLIVAIAFLWWNYHAAPMMSAIEKRSGENARISGEIQNTRAIIGEIRQRIASGVHQEKEVQLARLIEQLAEVERQLHVTTIELVDPEKMFQLINQLIYRESKLQLISLKRREVRAAIPPSDPENSEDDAGIYRHVLELQFAGSYPDILRYMQSMEALDWKLLWDEIEIVSGEYPKINVRVAMSTLSTRKEWVGI